MLEQFSYVFTVITVFAIYAIFALGQNIISGYAGLPMVGMMGLVAAGAYTTAILSVVYGLPFLVALPMSCLVTMALGFAIGLLMARAKLVGAYLVVGSIAINFFVVAILVFTPYFGRMYGVLGVPDPDVFGLSLESPLAFLSLCLALLAAMIYADIRLVKSSLGLGLKAIREDAVAAESSGVPVIRLKITAFTLAAIYAGLGGCLFAYFIGSAYPSFFEVVHSFEISAMAIFGGLGTTIGPIVGAFVMTMIPEALRGNAPAEMRFLINSLLILAVIMLEPVGILGQGSHLRKLIARIWKWFE